MIIALIVDMALKLQHSHTLLSAILRELHIPLFDPVLCDMTTTSIISVFPRFTCLT